MTIYEENTWVTGENIKIQCWLLYEGNPWVTGGFTTKKASGGESLSISWRDPGLFLLVDIVLYTRAYETSAGCLRSIYPSLGMRQLFGDVTMGQWRHN